jgi:AraC-like DNA-binding protein
MSEALKVKDSMSPTSSPLLKAIATYMFWQYFGEAELLLTESNGKSASLTMEKARGFIHHNLGNHLSVEMIAQAVNISRSQLTRIFKAELNITPIAYLWQQRVTLGIDMLRNTGLPVGVIADRCGFKSRYHFSRSVREATQMTPRRLRQSWLRGNN